MRGSDWTDEAVRRLPLPSDEQASLLSDRRAREALFEEIIAMPTTTLHRAAAPSRQAPRRRKPLLASIGAGVAIFGVAGTAWAMLQPSTTTATGCYISEDSVTVIDAVTGDPVRDCEQVWQRETGSVPPLTAYDTGEGVAVVPAGRAVPGDWRALEPGVVQDPQLIGLTAALDDSIDGLRADCHRLDAAQAVVQRELTNAGLTQWQIAPQRGQADGQETCTYFIVEPDARRVVLIPLQGLVDPDGVLPHDRLADDLRSALSGRPCTSVAEVASTVHAVVDDSRVDDVQIHRVDDPALACATADMVVGGSISITVRGPGK
jgi:hypothetical protein